MFQRHSCSMLKRMIIASELPNFCPGHARSLSVGQCTVLSRHVIQQFDSVSVMKIGREHQRSFEEGSKNELGMELKTDPDTFGNYSRAVSEFNLTKDDPEDVAELQRMRIAKQKSLKEYIGKIREHLKNGNYKEAVNVLEIEMLKIDKKKPVTYIYDLLIGWSGQRGNLKEAYRLYNRAKKMNIFITGGMYTSLFNACANCPQALDAINTANKVREYLLKDDKHRANMTNYNAMLKAYARHGDIKTCLSIIDELLQKNKCKIQSGSYCFLLQACITDKNSGFRHALLVWHQMLQYKTKPCIYSFNLMLRCVRDCSLGDKQFVSETLKKIYSESNTRSQRSKVLESLPFEIKARIPKDVIAKNMPYLDRLVKKDYPTQHQGNTSSDFDNGDLAASNSMVLSGTQSDIGKRRLPERQLSSESKIIVFDVSPSVGVSVSENQEECHGDASAYKKEISDSDFTRANLSALGGDCVVVKEITGNQFTVDHSPELCAELASCSQKGFKSTFDMTQSEGDFALKLHQTANVNCEDQAQSINDSPTDDLAVSDVFSASVNQMASDSKSLSDEQLLSDIVLPLHYENNSHHTVEQEPICHEFVGNNLTDCKDKTLTEQGTVEPHIQTPQHLSENELPNFLALRPSIGTVVGLQDFSTPDHRFMLLGGARGFLKAMSDFGVSPNVKTFSLMMKVIPQTVEAEEDIISLAHDHRVKLDTDFFNQLIKRRCARNDMKAAKDVMLLLSKARLPPNLMTFGVLALSCSTREDGARLISSVREAGFRVNSPILGALIFNARKSHDCKYIQMILKAAKEDEIEPCPRIVASLNTFLKEQQRYLKSNVDDKQKLLA